MLFLAVLIDFVFPNESKLKLKLELCNGSSETPANIQSFGIARVMYGTHIKNEL
jgi:hypothetical protein